MVIMAFSLLTVSAFAKDFEDVSEDDGISDNVEQVLDDEDVEEEEEVEEVVKKFLEPQKELKNHVDLIILILKHIRLKLLLLDVNFKLKREKLSA